MCVCTHCTHIYIYTIDIYACEVALCMNINEVQSPESGGNKPPVTISPVHFYFFQYYRPMRKERKERKKNPDPFGRFLSFDKSSTRRHRLHNFSRPIILREGDRERTFLSRIDHFLLSTAIIDLSPVYRPSSSIYTFILYSTSFFFLLLPLDESETMAFFYSIHMLALYYVFRRDMLCK